VNAPVDESRGIMRLLEFYFACLTVLGGLVLTVGNQGAAIPVIAILFAITGYVFVDVLRIMALPPTLAYIAMGLAAVLCITDFAGTSSFGTSRLVAVAQLLVLVQAILMIFCLLELIVAAVFNQSLGFGLMLIPITVIGALALGLLSALHVISQNNQESESISTSAHDSNVSILSHSGRASRIALLVSGPAVLLVAAAFFYGLPRLVAANRDSSASTSLVGFSDRLRLDQLGRMLRNPEVALRVSIDDATTLNPYPALGGIYLRGKVLEKYDYVDEGVRSTAIWNVIDTDLDSTDWQLPPQYVPDDSSNGGAYDSVLATIDCAQVSGAELFAIAPYHRVSESPAVLHNARHWTLMRASGSSILQYRFGTHAFSAGVQTDRIADSSTTSLAPLLKFDAEAMPRLAELAERLVTEQPQSLDSSYEIAKLLERHLAGSENYQYTLNPNFDPESGVDPIEQFVAVNRRGHCQFFASALAMMLRSQNVPARLVVGYYTNERSEWSDEYIARQLHAHAWVEARIDADDLPDRRGLAGQPAAEAYWVRLDPTPPSAVGGSDPGAIRQGIDLAQNVWDDYVLQVDAGQSRDPLTDLNGRASEGWVGQTARRLSRAINRMQTANFGSRFSFASWRSPRVWSFMLVGVAATVIALGVWIWLRTNQRLKVLRRDDAATRPTIEFYAQALDELARIGLRRSASQTPAEFACWSAHQLYRAGAAPIERPLARLTDAFYRQRFGPSDGSDSMSSKQVQADLAQLSAAVDQMIQNTEITGERHE